MILREMVQGDVDALFRLYESEEVTRYMENLFSREEEMEYIRSYYDCVYRFYGFGMWLIVRKDGVVMGRAGLELDQDGEYNLGYMLAPEYQHQGYALEACTGILQYAGECLEIEKKQIKAKIHPENKPSIRLAGKLGIRICPQSD